MQFIRLPIYVIQNLPIMRDGELRVVLVVAEHTNFDEWAALSFSDFESGTGLSRPTIKISVAEALEHGIIERRPLRNTFEYRLTQPSTDIEQIERETRAPTKRQSKPKKRKPPRPAEEIEKEKKAKAARKQFHVPLCKLFNGHDQIKELGKEKIEIYTAAKFLQEHDYTLEDLQLWEDRIWAEDWRAKNGGRPTLAILRQSMALVRQEAKPTSEIRTLESKTAEK